MSSRSANLERISVTVAICCLIASILSAIAAYLAIPEFKEFVRERVLQQRGVLYEEPRADSTSPNNFHWIDSSTIGRTGFASISDSFSCIAATASSASVAPSASAVVPVRLGKTRDYAVEMGLSLDAVDRPPYALGIFVRTGYDIILGSQNPTATAPIGITIQARDVESPRVLAQRPLPFDSREHLIRVEVRGSELKVFIDGSFALSATDDKHAYTDPGTVGLWCGNTAFTLQGVRVVRLQ
jgi:hypothetical protein